MDFASVWRPPGAAACWPAAGPRGASACRPEARPPWSMADPPVESAAEPRAEPVGSPRPDARQPRLATLKRRPEFQRVRTGARWATPAFVLEGKRREAPAPALAPAGAARFGFTVSKQVGGAVERNRIKRRLKAA